LRPTSAKPLPRLRLAIWLLLAGSLLYLYYSKPDFFGDELRNTAGTSMVAAYALYLGLGTIRGLSLIPANFLLILALPIFPPVPLYVLSLAGILFSSTIIYYFSESLKLMEHFEQGHAAKIEKIRALLQKWPTTIVIAWSFFPAAPTDLVCYLCGVLRISFGRFILGVLIGEGAIFAIYIFFGDQLLRSLGWRE
jgi:uncharacterized membrane protein YdjX (TVP38/TMEM64 family)